MTRRLLLSILVCGVILSTAALAYAPYLLRLLYEGYPAAIWPAPGAFAEISGKSPPVPIARSSDASERALPSDLAKVFDASGGRAILIDRAGRLELEHYSAGFGPSTKFNSFSMAKSLVGALIFKSYAEARIRSLDISIGEILSDYGDAAFQAVTIRDLLRMRGGVLFHRDDPLATEDQTKDLERVLYNPFGPMARLHAEGPTAIRLNLTANKSLANDFRYQNVNTAILAALLEKLYSRPIADLLSEKIWRPAGAGAAQWRRSHDSGSVSAYCCIFATSYDWIRVARYLLRNGTASKPFLPEPLWRELMGLDLQSAALHSVVYGYHFRHDILDRPGEALQGRFTYMLGQGGQILYILPEHDLIVLRFGERTQLLHTTLYAASRLFGAPAVNARP